MRNPIRNILFAAMLFLISGTLLSTTHDSDPQLEIDAALKKHVQPGVTGARDIIARFGDPLSREPVRGPGRSEVLGYHHQAVVPSVFPKLPLVTSPGDAAPDTFFEISDGVVARYWTKM